MVVRLPDCLAAARIAFHPATASSDLTREAALSVYRVDYNHAPPGLPAASSVRVEGSYLHLLAGLQVAADGADRADMVAVGGENRFVAGGYPADWTGARVTLGVRGELDAKGARLGLLAQSRVASIDRMVNSVLHFPDPVTAEWAEQTITLTADDEHWQCLGSRVDRLETYGAAPIAEVLAKMNGNIILVLTNLDIQPKALTTRGDGNAAAAEQELPQGDEIHIKRAGLDYPVDYDRLPGGFVEFDTIRIEFATSSSAAKL
jgi:hypothetical protein